MNNIFTIAKREFVTRAFRKKFILITVLTPVFLAVFSILVGVIMSYKDESGLRIGLIDPDNVVPDSIIKYQNLDLIRLEGEATQYKDSIGKSLAGILTFPKIVKGQHSKYKIGYLTNDRVNIDVKFSLEKFAEEYIRARNLQVAGLQQSEIDMYNEPVELESKSIDARKNTGGEVAAGIGAILGLLLYLLLTINGGMIMRSVMEEKTNRIIEVMINTVKPEQLMMGKILGVGMVGIFQVLVWLIVTPIMFGVALKFFGMEGAAVSQEMAVGGPNVSASAMSGMSTELFSQLSSINWFTLIPLFLLFFIAGYMLYASLFAAMGSTVGDDQGEGQSLVFLIIMPLIFGMYIGFSVIRAPDSPLAFWSSMIPFFSPIVMPARLAFNPPMWQVFVSLGLLIGSAIFFAWLSARIYRVGILMYGKKANLKDIRKWIFQK